MSKFVLPRILQVIRFLKKLGNMFPDLLKSIKLIELQCINKQQNKEWWQEACSRTATINTNIYFKIFYLFTFRETWREGEREGEKHQYVVASHPPPTGAWPETQICALTGNGTSDLLVHRLALNPLSHTSQGNTDRF